MMHSIEKAVLILTFAEAMPVLLEQKGVQELPYFKGVMLKSSLKPLFINSKVIKRK